MTAKGYTPPSRAELQAMREQKQTVQAGPMMEASRRADVIRAGLTSYAATMDKIADAYRREDWKALGYDSFNAYAGGEFGEARLKLTPEQRAQILPAFLAVGMSKRGAAAALGVDDKTIRNDLLGADNSAPKKKSPLVEAMTQAIEEAQSAAVTRPDTTPQGPPAAPPSDQVALVAEQPGLDSSTGASEASPPVEAPAGQLQDPDGSEAVPPPIDRPGIEPPTAVGEAPASGISPAAGVTPQVDDGDGVDREAVEDGDVTAPTDLSSTDPASAFMERRRVHHAELLREWPTVAADLLDDELLELARMNADERALYASAEVLTP